MGLAGAGHLGDVAVFLFFFLLVSHSLSFSLMFPFIPSPSSHPDFIHLSHFSIGGSEQCVSSLKLGSSPALCLH